MTSKKSSRKRTLDAEQIKLAVPALFSHAKKTSSGKKTLFDSNTAFWLMLALKKIPAPERKPKLIHLPHSIHNENEVCLFTKLPGKQVKEQLKTKGVSNITKVISLTKLKKNYKTFESKRDLCNSYDVFLCDERIYHLLPRFLGKTFFARKKEPTPVNMLKTDLKREIDNTLSSTKLRLGHGSCSSIRVGSTEQTEEEVVDNVIETVNQLSEIIPRGWDNIQALHLKTAESVALPLFNSLPDVEVAIEHKEPPTKKAKKSKS
eukprot:gene9013-9977_t